MNPQDIAAVQQLAQAAGGVGGQIAGPQGASNGLLPQPPSLPPNPQPDPLIPAAVPNPQQQAMQEAALAADQIFAAQTGESFLAKAQAGQVTPEEEQLFTGIVQEVLSGQLSAGNQAVAASPASIL